MNKKVLITGSGLGALTAALRLHRRGYLVELVEKHHQPGGRLNQLKVGDYSFDIGPTFFSMTYEFDEFVKDAGIEMPFRFRQLDALYTVSFRGSQRRFTIYRDLDRLAKEFEDVEPDFRLKMERFLQKAGRFFHDTEDLVIRRNFNSLWDYLLTLSRVPLKHSPLLIRTVWDEMVRHFESREVREIFSLVAFFLGATPFDTPGIYTILSYTELRHNGYHNVEGGMYQIVEGLKKELDKAGIPIHTNVEIVDFVENGEGLQALVDQTGKYWQADIFLVNADAAVFRGRVFRRREFGEEKLRKMKWTLAPFTMYLGLDTQIPNLELHNYFLGNNFREYSTGIFKNSIKLDKPYYYVNMGSRSNSQSAPPGHESMFILCPVPDLRFKPSWDDRRQVADGIVQDLSQRIGFGLKKHIVTQTVLTPLEWGQQFNLYQGSGLSLAHDLSQMGGLRPRNFDEKFKNVFYVGASTVPGTGLPMAVISSRLVVERIDKAYGPLHAQRAEV